MVEQNDVTAREERMKRISRELYEHLASLLLKYPELECAGLIFGWAPGFINELPSQTHGVLRMRPEYETSLYNAVILNRMVHQASQMATTLSSKCIAISQMMLAGAAVSTEHTKEVEDNDEHGE